MLKRVLKILGIITGITGLCLLAGYLMDKAEPDYARRILYDEDDLEMIDKDIDNEFKE